MLNNYLPIALLLLAGLGLAGVFTLLARILGPHRPSAAKNIPYESGMDPLQTPRVRFNVQFYRIALLFLVFDIEAAFFYPWAVLYREMSCSGHVVDGACQGGGSSFGFLVMAVFLAILLLALVFVWRKRALEWE